MTTGILEKLKIEDLQLDNISTYLRQKGWQPVSQPNQNLVLFQGKNDDLGHPIRLVLPRHTQFQDSQILLNKAIHLLAVIERKSSQVILSEIQAYSAANRFVSTINRLKSQYEHALTQPYSNTSYLREQLAHVDALLLDQLTAPKVQTHLSETGFSTLSQGDRPTLVPSELKLSTAVGKTSKAKASESAPHPTSASSANLRTQNKRLQNKTRTSTTQVTEVAPIAPVTSPTLPSNQRTRLRQTTLPLLPSYTGMTKAQAVTQVMEDHAGQAVSLDQIIELLHGELDINALKQERKRMRTIMWRGVDGKKWQRVKGKDSHYILPSKLLAASNGNSPSQTQATAKPARRNSQSAAAPKPARSSRAGKAKGVASSTSLMGSVEQVLRDNQGTPMRAEAIATALYGELTPARLKEVKTQIADRLAKGAKANRWQRIPKQLGVYVMG
jgi:DNA-binding transcriptional regulator YdaS (Cro superfamily)